MILGAVEVLIGNKEDLHDVRGDELAMLLSMFREILLSNSPVNYFHLI